MIFVTNCAGQMCNQFMYFARALALALDSRRRMYFLCGRRVREFSDLHPDALPGIRVVCGNLKPIKILDWFNGLLESILRVVFGRGVIPAEEVDRMAKRTHLLPILLWNWNFRNEKGMVRHQREIAGFLRAKEKYHQRARERLRRLPEHEIVVGVHIRRGDYKVAWGGRYWYSDEQYLSFLKRFSAALGRRVVFAAVSNEKINEEWFVSNGCQLVDVSGSPEEDVVLLSECDYIVGPPSTFSGWAAYYGDKLLYTIVDVSAPIDLSKLHKQYR